MTTPSFTAIASAGPYFTLAGPHAEKNFYPNRYGSATQQAKPEQTEKQQNPWQRTTGT
jgi:hypothetical protein